MDWRLHSILLLVFLLEGGSAQLKCEDRTMIEKKWECNGEDLKSALGSKLFEQCSSNNFIHIYCLFRAELIYNEWYVRPDGMYLTNFDKDVRRDPECIHPRKIGDGRALATCNAENCVVDANEVLDSCGVDYAKCNNKYLELNESIADINARNETVVCKWEYRLESGQWMKQKVMAGNENLSLFANGTLACLPSADGQSVTVFCYDEREDHAGDCDIAHSGNFEDKTYLEKQCSIQTTAAAPIENNKKKNKSMKKPEREEDEGSSAASESTKKAHHDLVE